ncbi:MAG: hypothetical protein HYU84_02495 [Chloroflexi bacterium]|nr:hypothetical protein [Chloroflexota bacterium]MBI3170258.1 hypothetical protein [Chloroflexota bacterium]
MPSKQLTLDTICGTDSISWIALKRMKLTPLGAGLFFLLAGILYAGILPRFWGYPLKVDGINLLNLALVFPMAGYFYAYQPKSILKTYESIAHFLREEDDEGSFHIDKIAQTHARKIWWIIGMVFGLLGAGFGISYSVEHFQEFWYSANWFEIILVQFVRFLAFYCIGVSACRHIATSIEMNDLFEHADLPLTIDADRLEVFRSIKNFALEFVGVAAVIALNLGLQPLLIDPPILEYIFYVSLYFIVAPISFFLPIWEAHMRMSKIKNGMLDRLNYDFQEESQKLYRAFGGKGKLTAYIKEAATLNQLEKAIETVSHSTDWPFQGTTFYRLVMTVVSPFLLVIFEIFINVISNLVVIN